MFPLEVANRLGDVAPRLFDEVDAMVDRMVDVLLRTEPAYRELDLVELRRSSRAGLAWRAASAAWSAPPGAPGACRRPRPARWAAAARPRASRWRRCCAPTGSA